jgi:hypothetical protein
MQSRRFIPLSILSAICAVASGAAEEGPSRDDVLREFSNLIPPGTITGSQVQDSNGFHLEFDRYKQLSADFKPNGDEFQSVFVSASGAFKTQVVKGIAPTINNGVSIYHRDSGAPLLTLSDSNGDGRPDALTYASVDVKGNVTMEATDYDMDGQADLRINFAEHYFEVWHVERWYRVETRDGRRGIALNGKFVELRKDKNRYYVP